MERNVSEVLIFMKIAICDDSHQDAMYLRSLLKENHDIIIYSGAEQLLRDLENKKAHYDLYLIDIYMEIMSGIDLAKRLRLKEEDAAICFISSSDAFYRQAYDLYAVQYLLKPVQKEDLRQLVEKISQRIAKNKELSLQFRWRGKMGMIPYEKILFVSSREHTLFIQCKDGTVQECKGKLNEIALKICGDTFLRCHQSFIINMYYVSSLNGNELFISNYRIPISRRYLPTIKRRYQEILFEEMD